jgi:hypothetical protein
MLRRPPTVIRLTTEDVLAHDDSIARKQRSQIENAAPAESKGASSQHTKGPTRDERIGIRSAN